AGGGCATGAGGGGTANGRAVRWIGGGARENRGWTPCPAGRGFGTADGRGWTQMGRSGFLSDRPHAQRDSPPNSPVIPPRKRGFRATVRRLLLGPRFRGGINCGAARNER